MSALKHLTFTKFKNYILANGGEILESNTPYEWCRFRMGGADGRISVVYTNDKGKIGSGFQNHGQIIFKSYINNRPIPTEIISYKTKSTVKKKDKIYLALCKRDGNNCFYCSCEVLEENWTLEHLIPKTAGGLNHLSNYAIACKECNREAGHRSLFEKIKLRERKLFNKEENKQ